MKTIRILTTILLTTAALFGATAFAFAEEYIVDYSSTYDGSEITTEYDEAQYDSLIGELEPGDTLTINAAYINESGEETDWYMKADVLETLEQGAAEGAGYIGTLINSSPDSSAPGTLFDSTQAGGEAANARKGMKQLTYATEDYFWIGAVPAGKSGSVMMKIKFDGESENNDYEETVGNLMMQFAVEDTEQEVVTQHTKTGDRENILLWIALMAVALLVAAFAVRSYLKDRKRGEQA